METKEYRNLFLEKSLLGRNTELGNPDKVIYNCIRLAYRDMLTAGRFYLVNDAENNIESRCNKFKLILENVDYVYSRHLIEEAFAIFTAKDKLEKNTINRYATKYGLSQKLGFFLNFGYD